MSRRKPRQYYRFAFVVLPCTVAGVYTRGFFSCDATSPKMAIRKFSGAIRRRLIPRRSKLEYMYRIDRDGATAIDLSQLAYGATVPNG